MRKKTAFVSEPTGTHFMFGIYFYHDAYWNEFLIGIGKRTFKWCFWH